MSKYLTFDIGGTMIKYGLVDGEGKIADYHLMESEAHLGGASIIHKIEKVIKDYLIDHSLAGIGISTAGVVDSENGTIVYANDNIPDYTGINFKQLIEAQFQIPCEVENDVACAGLSEKYYGAAKNKEISVCLTIGTGIGCCILIGDRIFHGSGHYAGEVGYMKIKDVQFEKVASTRALVQNVARIKKRKDINGEEVFELARSGDEICQREIERMCDYLAQGISIICYIINPDAVVLGGGIIGQGKYLHDIVSKKLDDHLIKSIRKDTELLFAQNGNQAGMLGAYCNFCIRQNIPCKSS